MNNLEGPGTNPAEWETLQSAPARHSALGVAAFATSLGIGVLMLITFVFAGIAAAGHARSGGGGQYPGQIIVGLVTLGLMGADVVALGLGIAALFQSGRKKVFAILGVVFASAILLGTAGVIVLGLHLAAKRAGNGAGF